MKSVLITGATSGIGLATTRLMLEMGYVVYGIGRNRETIQQYMEQYENFFFIKYDLQNMSSYQSIFDQVHNKLDGLIHCAGVEETLPINLYIPERVQEIFTINVFSAFELIRLFSKKKYSNDKSSIVLLSSVMGELGQAGKTGYCASKSAVLGLMRSASLELSKRSIRVNAILPGVVDTPMTQSLFSKLEEENIKGILKMHPLGIGETTDVSNLIEFLISDKSKWITGQAIRIDGGYSVS